MRWIVVMFSLLVLTSLSAQQIPDEATKITALKRAYRMNSNSMVRNGSNDLSHTDLSKPIDNMPEVSGLPISPDPTPAVKCAVVGSVNAYFDCPQPLKTERIIPPKKESDAFADRILVPPPEVKRHGVKPK
jgi:hypothetical protein